MKVDFLICGTQKGGTSALDAYLREHSEICMARNKEVHFFNNENNFQCGQVDYSTYHSEFEPTPLHKSVGEATPIYMYWHDAARRIWDYNPLMKLIVLLRNPIERAYSHWNMEQLKKKDNLSFWDAIQTEAERCRKSLPYQHPVFSYVDRGFYVSQLRKLWSYFGKEQVLVLKSESLKCNPRESLDKVCAFLELSRFETMESLDIHSRPYLSKMSDKEKQYLHTVYEYEIRAIERILGWDCSDWLSC